MAFLLAAVLLSFPYVAANLWDGYLCGRYDACLNRLRARQEAEFAAADTARRADPGVQAALTAIGHVRNLLGHKAMLEGRIAATAAPFDAQIAEKEARRLPILDSLPEESLRRIQDRKDDFNGAQALWNARFYEAREAVEPLGGFWRRLVRLLFPGRAHQRHRDARG